MELQMKRIDIEGKKDEEHKAKENTVQKSKSKAKTNTDIKDRKKRLMLQIILRFKIIFIISF